MSERIAALPGLLSLAAVLATGAPGAGAAEALGACGDPATRVHAIQGAARSSPLRGREGVVVEAVVVGHFPGFPQGLGGFFVQEEDAHTDGDPATSEGLFVFDGGLGDGLRPGDRVRVRGAVGEFFGRTELSRPSGLIACPPTGDASPVRLRLPVARPDDWERWEGMRVRIEQPLVATGQHALGRFGEVVLAAGGRLWAPTHRAAPGAPALARLARDGRHRILLDDGSDAFRPAPVPHLERPDGGTLRLGDVADRVEGVVDFAFGRFRIQPTGPVRFAAGTARPEAPPPVAGTLRVATWNLANHMNGDGRGGGFPTRGPADAIELERQRAKLVETLARLAPDVAALVEIENDGSGTESALARLARALSARGPGAAYAAIDPGRSRLGGQAVAVGLLYRPDAAVPVGSAAVLDARAHPDFDDLRNRPVLAQTFESTATGERVTVAVAHLKSKGSSCEAAGDPDLGDGQGDCNATRTRAARALVEWLGTDPTESRGAPPLIVGDLNAYPQEDPVRAIEAAGYVDLLAWFAGPEAYSFVFDGQAGRLDHALGGADLLALAGGAGVWHANADEARPLDYRTENPPERYAPDPFRASDHDPVLVGLFPDADADGLTDARDACPRSSLRPTLVVGACDTGAPEQLDEEGCTLADRLGGLLEGSPRRGPALRAIQSWLGERIRAGAIDRRHRGAIAACAAGAPFRSGRSRGPSRSPWTDR